MSGKQLQEYWPVTEMWKSPRCDSAEAILKVLTPTQWTDLNDGKYATVTYTLTFNEAGTIRKVERLNQTVRLF
jgi:hypothetical protein